jgi:hypothetical protein
MSLMDGLMKDCFAVTNLKRCGSQPHRTLVNDRVTARLEAVPFPGRTIQNLLALSYSAFLLWRF